MRSVPNRRDEVEHPMKSRLALLFTLVLLHQGPLSAASKDFPQGVSKGTTVVVKVPFEFWSMEKERYAGSEDVSGSWIYAIDVERVLNEPKWQTKSFPFMTEFRVEKIGEWKSPIGARYTQIEIRTGPTIWLKLRFDPSKDLDSRFREIVAVEGLESFKKSEYFRTRIFEPLDSEIFVGPLSTLSPKMKMALLEFVKFRMDGITAGTYKGKSYISIDLGEEDSVYNSLRLDQAARVARVINERLLSVIKTFSSVAEEAGIDGVKLVTVIQYKSFLDELAAPKKDKLEIYAPLDMAQQFDNAEMTSQQLMDASVILLNDNRIQAVLSSSAT